MSSAILFDLDGTLLDTARDFAHVINVMLKEKNKPAIDFPAFREQVHGESRRMISFAFNILESDAAFERLRDEFLGLYHSHCTLHTVFFPGIEKLLNEIEKKNIPWGIVTSKPTWLAKPVLKHFGLSDRASCIVMGDTLENVKPHPAPLIFACEKLLAIPEQSIYVGDLHTDIIAAKAAGMKSVAVTYGYHPPKTNFAEWQADVIAQSPDEISELLVKLTR